MTAVIESLQRQIASCEATLVDLRQQLIEAEHSQRQHEKVLQQDQPSGQDPLDHDMNFGIADDFRSEVFAVLGHGEQEAKKDIRDEPRRWPLNQNEYKRYGRQLIMPEVGLRGEQGLHELLLQEIIIYSILT